MTHKFDCVKEEGFGLKAFLLSDIVNQEFKEMVLIKIIVFHLTKIFYLVLEKLY